MTLYTVEKAKDAGLRDNPRGGQLRKWYVAFRDPAGNVTTDVYWQRKPESTVEVGESFEGAIEDGDYGPRFRMATKDQGGGGSGGGGGMPPERQRAIQRQHSQEMAIRTLAYVAQHFPGAQPDGTGAIRAELQDWADFFDRDVESVSQGAPESSSSGAGQNSPGASAPPAAAPPGDADALATDGQLKYLEGNGPSRPGLFEKAGLDGTEQVRAIYWASGGLPSLTKAGASKLIEVLADDPAGGGEWLRANCPAVSDVPGNNDGLEPVGAGAIADDDDIPF